MSCVYAVRCNFSRPDLEADWNAWYSGPKLAHMLTKPLFQSGQRFAAESLDVTLKYLALWVVESPEAFTTPEYKSNWGFFEWAPHIIDWSRNVYQGPEGDVASRFSVPPGGALYFVAFDDVPADEVEPRRRAVEAERPGLTWLPAIGLDRSCPLVGIQALPDGQAVPPLSAGLTGVRETIYRPISECRRAG